VRGGVREGVRVGVRGPCFVGGRSCGRIGVRMVPAPAQVGAGAMDASPRAPYHDAEV